MKIVPWLFPQSEVSSRELYLVACLVGSVGRTFQPLIEQLEFEWRASLVFRPRSVLDGMEMVRHAHALFEVSAGICLQPYIGIF